MEREIKLLETTASQLLATTLDEHQRKLVMQLVTESFKYLEESKRVSEFTLQSHKLLSLELGTQRRDGLDVSTTSQH